MISSDDHPKMWTKWPKCERDEIQMWDAMNEEWEHQTASRNVSGKVDHSVGGRKWIVSRSINIFSQFKIYWRGFENMVSDSFDRESNLTLLVMRN